MMKLIFYITILSFTSIGWTQKIEEVRKKFHEAVLDPDKSENFHQFVLKLSNDEPVFLAYKAASEALLAQVAWNPFSKFSLVTKYDKMMEQVFEMDSSNLEIRFLRLAIEYHLPAFLGMSEHVKEDSQYIKANLMTVKTLGFDRSFSKYIMYFMEHTGFCTKNEINGLREAIDNE